MTRYLPKVLLSLLVVNLGVVLGAGLYESRIVFPQWLAPAEGGGLVWNAGAARSADTGLRFWIYVTTVPLTLLTIANLLAALRFRGAGRRWWLGAVAAVAAERLMTFSYFIPTMVRLQDRSGLSADEAVSMASQWGQLSQLRHALVLAALVGAVVAHGEAAPSLSGRRTRAVG